MTASPAPGAPEPHAGAPVAAVVYNPTKVQLDQLRAAVSAAERDAGWGPTLWFATTVDDPGSGMTRDALAQDAAIVMAAGGDGTVRAVAEALRGTGVPIGLLPAGTGNLLARNLDLTLAHLDTSVRTAFTGADRPIDLGVLEAERPDGSRQRNVFLVMAGFGLDAQMIAHTRPELKRRVGWLAYAEAIARSLRDRHRVRLRYKLDDEPVRAMRVHTILIGNCGSLPGNILLLPEAAVDDGLFDIVALRPEGLLGWLQIWLKITWENGILRRTQVGRKLMGLRREIRTLRYLKGRRLILRLDQPEEYELDGDAFGAAIAIRTWVDPGALLVRTPRVEHVGPGRPHGAGMTTSARPVTSPRASA